MSDEATTRAIRWLRIPPRPAYGRKLGTPGQVHKGGFERHTAYQSSERRSTTHTAARGRICCELDRSHTYRSSRVTPTALTPNHFLGQPPADGSRDISTPLKNVPENSERVRRSQRCSGRDGCENTPTLQRRHKWTEGRPPIKVGDAVVITDPALPRNTWPRGIVERVYPGIDGQVRVVDIRTAHGRLRRPTARLAVLPTEVESSHARPGWIVDGRITTALRAVAAGEGCGVGPLIGRAVRDARAREGGRARRTALLYASAARHSQSAFNRRRGNTLYPSSETKFWSALRPPPPAAKRSPPPASRPVDRRPGGPPPPATHRLRHRAPRRATSPPGTCSPCASCPSRFLLSLGRRCLSEYLRPRSRPPWASGSLQAEFC
ncbi:hypothetical protein EVAR_91265_1 [Eumeta japonica]|uniref:DUF5641 domain-containing protein n=1 Tax=Eumeta variegata TaxID=151549 RepID=A0A4C1T5U2_EUMVA|nr:hypothetical protein EVAR_91265_1 [Eumeta japonica]